MHARHKLLFQCLLLIAVIALGQNIPVPGLNHEVLLGHADSSSSGMQSLSIFALAASPLLSVLMLVELAKLIFPRLETWRLSSERNAGWLHMFVIMLVAGFAALSGYGLVYALRVMELGKDMSEGLAIAAIAAYVGATMVIVWLAGRVRLAGIASGLWLLLAIFYLPNVNWGLMSLFEYMRIGAVSFQGGLLYYAFVLAGIVAVVAINRTVELASRDEAVQKGFFLSALLWPPFIAGFIASYLAGILHVFLAELLSLHAPSLIFFIFPIIEAVLIPLVILAYYRFIVIFRPDIADRDHVRPILLSIAGVQIMLGLGLGLAPNFIAFPATLSGNILIVCTTVLYLIGAALRPVDKVAA